MTYRLNRDHLAAGPIIELAHLQCTLLTRLEQHLAGWAIQPTYAAVFVSSARGEMTSSSDLDLLLVRPDEASQTTWDRRSSPPLTTKAAMVNGSRPNAPTRKVTPRTAAEQAFCALGPVAEQWLLEAAHGRDALVAALERAITFGRWRASGVRSILAAGAGVAQPTAPGEALVLELPRSASRSLADYKLDDLNGGA